ncbi:hypothetical protein Gogos_005628 [Gossypium gossypioides]|uniref:Uncharacterized protein n=1 Tax=Gossypium gossypioides TaxID=34282 RepID=A0A7J9CXG3_GOSGO|nr:hypothetical protein [Gossypium gossypioides]
MIRVFIKCMDERAWRFILTSREPFTTDVSGVKTPKPETTWITEERKMENKKSKSINATFHGMGPQEFKCISKRANGIDTIRIDELIGSLQTFEMTLEETKKRKGKTKKNIALQVASLVATEGETIIEDSHNN